MRVTDLSPLAQAPSRQGQRMGAPCPLPAKAQHPQHHPEPGLLQVPVLSPRGAPAPHRQAVEQGCVFSLRSWKEAPAVTRRPSHAPHGALQTTRQFINAAPQIRRFVRHGEAEIAGPVPDPRRVGGIASRPCLHPRLGPPRLAAPEFPTSPPAPRDALRKREKRLHFPLHLHYRLSPGTPSAATPKPCSYSPGGAPQDPKPPCPSPPPRLQPPKGRGRSRGTPAAPQHGLRLRAVPEHWGGAGRGRYRDGHAWDPPTAPRPRGTPLTSRRLLLAPHGRGEQRQGQGGAEAERPERGHGDTGSGTGAGGRGRRGGGGEGKGRGPPPL